MKLINKHGRIPMPPPYEVCQMQAWGSGAATPPHPPPYMFLTKFLWRSMQQMQEEGTANIAYQIGNLHHWSNLEDGRHNHNTRKDTTRRNININRQKIKEERGKTENNNAFKLGLIFSFYFSLFSAFVQVYICVAFSIFIYFQHA
jgi:hypothetical protein